MKKLISIVSVLTLTLVLNAQSLATGIQYLGAAASANAAKKQQAEARGEKSSLKIAFQMDVEVSGRAQWGVIPLSSTGICYDGAFLRMGGNRTITGGPGVNLDLGVRFNDSYFIGVGAQFEANFGNVKASLGTISNFTVKATNLSIPIYGVFKVYMPSSTNVSPYFDLGVGGYLPDWYQLKASAFKEYNLDVQDSDIKLEGDKLRFRTDKGGFYLHAAVGVDINHFLVSAGYELNTATENANTRLYHNVFLKLGFRIGG